MATIRDILKLFGVDEEQSDNFFENLSSAATRFSQWISDPEVQKGIQRMAEWSEQIKEKTDDFETLDEYLDEVSALLEEHEVGIAISSLAFRDINRELLEFAADPDQDLAELLFVPVTSDEFISRLDDLVDELESIDLLDSASVQGIREALLSAGDDRYIAAYRTLVPDIERIVVSRLVKHGRATRCDGKVYELDTEGAIHRHSNGEPIELPGICQKAARARKTADGPLQQVFTRLESEGPSHNPSRHGEQHTDNQRMLTIAICQLYALLFQLRKERRHSAGNGSSDTNPDC